MTAFVDGLFSLALLVAAVVLLGVIWSGVARWVRNNNDRRRDIAYENAERFIGKQLEAEAFWFKESPPAMFAILAVAKEMKSGQFSMERARSKWKAVMADRFPPQDSLQPNEGIR